MTTKNDNLENRVNNKDLGLGQELTVGVPDNGMQNASGDYPRREYNFGSSINQGALGTKIHKLYTGGGDANIPLNIPEQMPSQYPFSQVDETPSGHVIEMDDTPGGERVLIKHRKGSGVELRADGSVVISALNNKVEVTGGDQTVIIEGNGNLVYNGNLNLKVSGDYNVDVGGNYNVTAGGNTSMRTKRDHFQEVTGDTELKYLQTRTEKIQGSNTSVRLNGDILSVKGKRDVMVEGDLDLSAKAGLLISGGSRVDISSYNLYAHALNQLKLVGAGGGLIGGPFMRFTGQTYSGAIDTEDEDAEDFETAIFHGTFKGTADKAIHAQKANTSVSSLVASFALYSDAAGGATYAGYALGALKSASTAAGPSGVAPTPVANPVPVAAPTLTAANAITGLLAVNDMLASFPQEAEGGHITVEARDVASVIRGDYVDSSGTPINHIGKPRQFVKVDAGDHVRKDFKGMEHYRNGSSAVFRNAPNISEIRSAFRNPLSRNAGKGKSSEVATLLVAEGRLNAGFINPIPPGNLSGRTVEQGKSNSKYGYTPIGNSIENKGKKFRK